MTKIKKKVISPHARKDVGKLSHLQMGGGNTKCYIIMENSYVRKN